MCNAEHKVLQIHPKDKFTRALYLLLQMPTVRLKEISLGGHNRCHEYLHLSTLHPDFQVKKLVIDMDWKSCLDTFQTDLISLFGKPSLQKIVISGNWGNLDEVKLGVMEGLRCRSRSFPLKKVSLELVSSAHYKMREFESLCLSIFSLPSLESLKLVLGKGFADMIRQPRFEEIVYKCWTRRASGVQLKSICLRSHTQAELKHLSLISQDVSFSFKEEEVYLGNLWRNLVGFDNYNDYDSDDHYCSYYDGNDLLSS